MLQRACFCNTLQEVLWEKLSEALTALVTAATAAWHVQRVLAKKRDPLLHVLFLDQVAPPGTPTPCDAFWCGRPAVIPETHMNIAMGDHTATVAAQHLSDDHTRVVLIC